MNWNSLSTKCASNRFGKKLLGIYLNTLMRWIYPEPESNIRHLPIWRTWQSNSPATSTLWKHRDTMLKDAMSVYPISIQAFDRNKYLFNCKNGTLDLKTMEFREHRPEDYLTMESGIVYDPDADCPRWHTFIQEVMCGDPALADFFQRSLPYALIRNYWRVSSFMFA